MLSMGQFDIKDGGPSFRNAVSRVADGRKSVGFCVSQGSLRNASTNQSVCCGRMSGDDAHGRSCFRVDGIRARYVCLNAGLISSGMTCRRAVDCSAGGAIGAPRRDIPEFDGPGVERSEGGGRRLLNAGGDSKMHCLFLKLNAQKQLVDVRVRSASSGKVMRLFYEGYAEILGQSVTVSSYIPRKWDLLPRRLLQLVAIFDVPNVIERYLQYLCSISLGLAVLNMAPVLFLDGENSVPLFVKILLPSVGNKRVKRIRAGVLLAGSSLLVINLFLGIWTLNAE